MDGLSKHILTVERCDVGKGGLVAFSLKREETEEKYLVKAVHAMSFPEHCESRKVELETFAGLVRV